MKIRVGSRGSQLALTQTENVLKQLQEKHPDITYEIKVITTKGDRIQHVSLDKIGGKGVFVKEIEKALLAGEIDLAVHSMKDMPSVMPTELIFAPTPKREDPRDVLVTRHKLTELSELPKGAMIGTGSKRRRYQLLKIRDDLQIVDIRGNIDTRINKMLDQGMDGIILAAAGLNRLGIKSCEAYQCYPLEVEDMLPSPTQGILALQLHRDNTPLRELLATIEDPMTMVQAKAERALLKTLNGSCHLPIGAYCNVVDTELRLTGLYGDEAGKYLVKQTILGHREDEDRLGEILGNTLLEEVRRWQEGSI